MRGAQAKLAKICQNCEPDAHRNAEIYCKDCRVAYCRDCDTRMHQNIALRNHERVGSLLQYNMEILKNCGFHKNQFRSELCLSCDEFVCPICRTEGRHPSTSHSIVQLLDIERDNPSPDINKSDVQKQISHLMEHQENGKDLLKNLRNLFDRLKNEIQKCQSNIFKYCEEELDKQEEAMRFMFDLNEVGSSSYKDLFVKRYFLSLKTKSIRFKQNSESIMNNIKEFVEKNISNLKQLSQIENLLNKPQKFIVSRNFRHRELTLSNIDKQLTKLDDSESWLRCFIESDSSKIILKVEKILQNRIRIGVCEKDERDFFESTMDQRQREFLPPRKLNSSISNFRNEPKYDSFSKLGKLKVYEKPFSERVVPIGNNTFEFQVKAYDTIGLSFDMQKYTATFSTNYEAPYHINLNVDDPCFFVELYDINDSVSIL